MNELTLLNATTNLFLLMLVAAAGVNIEAWMLVAYALYSMYPYAKELSKELSK